MAEEKPLSPIILGKKTKKKKAVPVAGAKNRLATPIALHQPINRERAAARAEKLAKKIGDKLRVTFITARRNADENITYLSTGHQILDDAITGERDADQEIIDGSGKGFPRGRIVEISGKEASVKTGLSLSVIAAAQQRGEQCAFIDVEHALNDHMAAKLFGVDMDSLLWFQPDDGEEAIDVLKALVDEGVSVVVLDSVSALVSMAELKGGNGIGEQARTMSKLCRVLTAKLKSGGPLIIFINQIRMKIGVMFGNPETTSGGNALLFYSSVRVHLRKKKDIKKKSKIKGMPKIVGIRVAMKVIKNKVAPLGGYAEFTLDFSKGIRFDSMASQDDEDDEA